MLGRFLHLVEGDHRKVQVREVASDGGHAVEQDDVLPPVGLEDFVRHFTLRSRRQKKMIRRVRYPEDAAPLKNRQRLSTGEHQYQ